jgi:hypothetical protein
MEPGYIVDHGDDNFSYQSEWIAGEPQRRRWLAGVKVGKGRRYPIRALRCEQCGFLASYAVNPVDDSH